MAASSDHDLRARTAARKLYEKAATDPLERLRLYSLSKGVNGIKSLGSIFRGFDDNKDGVIPPDEFYHGLASYGVDMSRREMEDVFRAVDKDRNGFIVYDEFLAGLRPPMSDARVDVVLAAFDKMDRNGDGYITVEDLSTNIDMGYNEDVLRGNSRADDVKRKFLRNFEKDGNPDGKVTEEEFINYYSGVSASVDEDEYFVFMMSRAYDLENELNNREERHAYENQWRGGSGRSTAIGGSKSRSAAMSTYIQGVRAASADVRERRMQKRSRYYGS